VTTRTLSRRDAEAKAAIEAVVRKELAGTPLERIIVTPRENHSGEPALYVLVVVASEQAVPTEPEQNRLVAKMVEALEHIDEPRFPYLYFGFNYRNDGTWIDWASVDEKS